MKSELLFLLLIIFLFTESQYSQNIMKEGTYTLSGSVSFSYNDSKFNDNESTSKSFSFSPQFLYFLSDQILLGGNIRFSYLENELKNNFFNVEEKIVNKSFSIGPILRYYFTKKYLNPFVEGSFLYSELIGRDSQDMWGEIGGGINYFLSNAVALEPFVNYAFLLDSDEDNRESSTIVFGMRIQYYIGN